MSKHTHSRKAQYVRRPEKKPAWGAGGPSPKAAVPLGSAGETAVSSTEAPWPSARFTPSTGRVKGRGPGSVLAVALSRLRGHSFLSFLTWGVGCQPRNWPRAAAGRMR